MLAYLPYLITAILYAPVFFDLYRSGWKLLDYTHAYFILPVSLWIVWQNRAKLRELAFGETQNSYRGLGLTLLVLGVLLYFFGWRQEYLFIKTVSLLPVLFGVTLYVWGPAVTRVMSFPIGYLLLLVPPPMGILDAVTLPMRYATSVAATVILQLLMLPVRREGLLIYIGTSEIYMGAPCSGLRSLVTMLSLGLVYAYFSRGPFRKKLILTGCIIPFALIGNLVRVLAMCLVTYFFGEEVGQGFYHNFSGIVIFVILVLSLIWLDRRLGGEDYEEE